MLDYVHRYKTELEELYQNYDDKGKLVKEYFDEY